MLNNQLQLLVIGGPTGSGKTKLAIELANLLGCEIISADSRQVYKELCIGTAVPTEEELSSAPHHLIQHCSIAAEYNAGIYEQEVIELLPSLFARNQYVILVGGTGLYINAVCKGLDDFPEVVPEVRTYYQQVLDTEGIEPLLSLLAQKDPVYFATVDQSNPRRITRALEVMHNSGLRYSDYRSNAPKQRPFMVKRYLLDLPRPVLYERINQRVLQMVAQGLEAEVESLLPFRSLKAVQTVGYQEFFQYFEQGGSLPATIERIQQNTRRYAKRQMTWFNNQAEHWERVSDVEKILLDLTV